MRPVKVEIQPESGTAFELLLDDTCPLWVIERAAGAPDFDRSIDGLSPQRIAIARHLLKERKP